MSYFSVPGVLMPPTTGSFCSADSSASWPFSRNTVRSRSRSASVDQRLIVMSTVLVCARGAVLLMSTANAVNFSGAAMLDWAAGPAAKNERAAAVTAAVRARRIEPPIYIYGAPLHLSDRPVLQPGGRVQVRADPRAGRRVQRNGRLTPPS